jgi:hypothetical protein
VTFAPEPADFGLSPGGGWPMRMIRLATFSRYGHCAVAETVHPSGAVVVIEAMPGGVRRRTARPGEFVWSDVNLDDTQRDVVREYCRAALDVPYDWPAIFRFGRRWWAAHLLPHRKRHARLTLAAVLPDGHLFCSELAVRAYAAAGVPVRPDLPPDAVSPGDLRQWLDDQRRALRRT